MLLVNTFVFQCSQQTIKYTKSKLLFTEMAPNTFIYLRTNIFALRSLFSTGFREHKTCELTKMLIHSLIRLLLCCSLHNIQFSSDQMFCCQCVVRVRYPLSSSLYTSIHITHTHNAIHPNVHKQMLIHTAMGDGDICYLYVLNCSIHACERVRRIYCY